MPNLVDPHILLYVRGLNNGSSPREQELRRAKDLGLYTVVQLENLLDELEAELENWVASNPPAEP